MHRLVGNTAIIMDIFNKLYDSTKLYYADHTICKIIYSNYAVLCFSLVGHNSIIVGIIRVT